MMTFKEYLEREREREALLSAQGSELSKSLRDPFKFGGIGSETFRELENKNRAIQETIKSLKIPGIDEAVEKMNAQLDVVNLVKNNLGISGDLSSIFTPLTNIYSDEIKSLKSNYSTLGSEAFASSAQLRNAKDLQKVLELAAPKLDHQPILRLEEALKKGETNPFEGAESALKNAEAAERNSAVSIDISLEENFNLDEKGIDVLIVTGLMLELRVFCDVFQVKRRSHSKKFHAEYYFGSIESRGRIYTVALAVGEDMGNFHASQVTFAATEELAPQMVFSAGIGYTLNPSRLQLCDLHVTDSIIYWGSTSKEYSSGRKVRSIPIRVRSNHLYQEAKKYTEGLRSGLKPFSEWVAEATIERPKCDAGKIKSVLEEIGRKLRCDVPNDFYNEAPRVEVGRTMVSDDAVIASILELKKRSLFKTDNENQISGEMEAAGVAMALGMIRRDIEFLAVRAICDFGFGKEALEQSSVSFRQIAAIRVATFIRSFIQSDPMQSAGSSIGLPLDQALSSHPEAHESGATQTLRTKT